jgi:fatty-acyl-CoA synthase
MPAKAKAAVPSYASGASDQPLLGVTIGEALDATVERFPDREALVVPHQSVRWTYRELGERVEQVARALLAIGVEKGERVGIWSTNRAEWTLTQFASAKIGAVLVNINPAYRAGELEYALNQSGCATLVLADRFKTTDFPAILGAVAPELAAAEPLALKSERLPGLKRAIILAPDGGGGLLPWTEFLERAEEVSREEVAERGVDLSFDEPINIQYTSGTTGFPKGATLSHHNILNNGYFVARLMNFTERDRLAIPVPLYHCFGMVMGNLGCVTHGATMIYPGEVFEAGEVLQAVSAERATALFGVPTMFIAELEHPEFARFDLTSLRTGIMAGAPCPVEVMRRVIDDMHMPEVEIGYGMTETSPVSMQTRVDAPLEKRVSTVGRVHPHVEVKIVDPESGALVPREVVGEFCTRGYSVMLGYWDNPEATASTVDASAWLHSGDLASMDAEGYVNIVGRIKDMIIRGGENIYPREIEEYLFRHPKVVEAQVIGVPDSRYGEELMAWVKLRPGESANEEEIRAFLRGQVSHQKIPRYLKFVEAFPMTVTGKIQKYRMREIAVEELGLEEPVKTA